MGGGLRTRTKRASLLALGGGLTALAVLAAGGELLPGVRPGCKSIDLLPKPLVARGCMGPGMLLMAAEQWEHHTSLQLASITCRDCCLIAAIKRLAAAPGPLGDADADGDSVDIQRRMGRPPTMLVRLSAPSGPMHSSWCALPGDLPTGSIHSRLLPFNSCSCPDVLLMPSCSAGS